MNKTGFGFLRLPMTADKQIDYTALNPLVDRFLELGGTYFDTAYTYLKGLSEEAIRKSLVERYPRERFRLADKLPGYKAKSYEACQAYFDEQLRRCGVTYFDVYMLHWLNGKNYAIAEEMEEFRFLQECKAQGKARKIGFSYHDGPELLERILCAHPEVDIVQLQINYLDWESVSIQAARCYDVAVRHGKEVVVMEPVKGGSLAVLPKEAEAMLHAVRPADSVASWAIRFATSLEQVSVVLSGMNTMEQVEDNLRPLEPLQAQEYTVLARCAGIIRSNTAIGCTGCGYCVPNCPAEIPIPQYFALYNDYARTPAEGWKMQHVYDALAERRDISRCVGCRKCEENCPQGLGITAYLQDVRQAFGK